MNNQFIAKEFHITGVVQGVGFRPFLFRLAHAYHLKGEVFNTANGVTLIIEGSEDRIEHFRQDIISKKPPLSIIFEIASNSTALSGYKAFSITASSEQSFSKSALISPDVSVCPDCLKEMHDPGNRRFEYPFINCTNCGPRYTIIQGIPYDRAKTSMNLFTMCSRCQKEYDNPFDRRFHAQPNACQVCGPHLTLVDNMGNDVKSSLPETPLESAARFLKQGKIVAVKGLGGFHLSVDAMNRDAVARLRRGKNRPHKPFALMAISTEVASRFVHISFEEKLLLESYNRPIVLLLRRSLTKQYGKSIISANRTMHRECPTEKDRFTKDSDITISHLSDCQIAPDNPFWGIMLPYTPLHYLLLEKGPSILVMTSGNRSGEPLSIENGDALDAFSHIADYFLLHNRDIYFRVDDSIVQVQNRQPRFFRRSRGYAPLPIILCKKSLAEKSVLGCGAGMKNCVCLTSGNRAFLSQHIGDLDNEKVFSFYQDSIRHLKNILDIEPEIIAHDLHPDYLSTRFAKSIANQDNKTDITLVPVQHHHAHAVSCMAENGLQGEVIAITLDGTGLGTDGNIWGGEILVCSETAFQRKAHLEYMPMPGGDAVTKEPWRMTLSYLYSAFGDDLFDLDIPFLKEISHDKLSFMVQMIRKKLNTPLTSSCGRLFDAVASLCSIRHEITFESQAAIELQAKNLHPEICKKYNFSINALKGEKDEKIFVIDPLPSIKDIVNDIHNKVSKEYISSKFHQTVIDMFVDGAENIRLDYGIKRVVLSGGVFNNTFILTGMTNALEKRGFKVYSHSKVPSGDGGVALGQAVIAGIRSKDKRRLTL